MQYIYPQHLAAKPTIYLWSMKSLAVIGVLALFSVFVLAQTGALFPLVLTVLIGFLNIQVEGTSVMDFLTHAVAFFLTKQQDYRWRDLNELV